MDLIVVGCGFSTFILLTVQDQTAYGVYQTPSSRAVMQYIRAVNQGGWLARLWQDMGGELILLCTDVTR